MEIPKQNRNMFNQLSHISSISKPLYHKYSTLELSPRITTKSVKNIINEIRITDVFKIILQDCAYQAKDLPIHLQSDMLNRKLLIEKMQKVIVKYNYAQSSFHYAIYLMDIIYQKGKSKLSLEEIAIGSLFLSIKFNEDFLPISSLKTLTNLFEPYLYYSNDHLRKIEIGCLKVMNYDISIVTPYIALELILLRGVVFSSDKTNYDSVKTLKSTIATESRKQLEHFIRKTFLYSKYNPFLLTISIVCLIREKTGLNHWNEMFAMLYNIQEKKIRDLITFLDEISIEQYTDRLRKRLKNYKRKEIKVNTSSNINKFAPISISHSNHQKSIESYYRKSQRSTSASLDDTPSARYNIRTKSQVLPTEAKPRQQKASSYKPQFTCSSLDNQECGDYYKKIMRNKRKAPKLSNTRPNIFEKTTFAFSRKNSVLIRSSMNIEKAFSLTTMNNNPNAKLNKNNGSLCSINTTSKKLNSNNDLSEKYHKITNKINQMLMKRIKKRMSDSQEKHSKTFTLKESINQSFKNLNSSSEYLVIKQKTKKIMPYANGYRLRKSTISKHKTKNKNDVVI